MNKNNKVIGFIDLNQLDKEIKIDNINKALKLLNLEFKGIKQQNTNLLVLYQKEEKQ